MRVGGRIKKNKKTPRCQQPKKSGYTATICSATGSLTETLQSPINNFVKTTQNRGITVKLATRLDWNSAYERWNWRCYKNILTFDTSVNTTCLAPFRRLTLLFRLVSTTANKLTCLFAFCGLISSVAKLQQSVFITGEMVWLSATPLIWCCVLASVDWDHSMGLVRPTICEQPWSRRKMAMVRKKTQASFAY